MFNYGGTNLKKTLLSMIILLFLLPSLTSAKESQISLLINGSYVTKGASPVILNNVTYVPLRNLFENIDFSVVYSSQYKIATAFYNKGNFRLDFAIDSNVVDIQTTYINAKFYSKKITGKTILYNKTVYVPVRAFSELFKSNVYYDKPLSTVVFNSTVSGIKQAIFPLVGLSLTDPRDNPNSDIKSEPSIPNTETPTTKKILTPKEIAKLMDRVGYVESYNSSGNAYASGSGFVLENHIFVTNHHVIKDGVGITVKLDGLTYDNKGWYLFDNDKFDLFGVYLSSSYSDVGRVTGTSPSKYLPFSLDLPEIGDKVYAIGSPLGLENTLSEGIVSGIRDNDGVTMIQHTADTDHGSSGGALINEYGEVIGITSSGVEGSNLEFAIPIKYVFESMKK